MRQALLFRLILMERAKGFRRGHWHVARHLARSVARFRVGAVSCTIADGDILAGKISFYSQCQSVKPKRPDIHQKTLGPGLRRDDDIKAASS